MTAALRGMLSPAALLCALVFASAELLVIFSRTSWIGFLGYTPEWANAGLYIASPLAAGASAFLARGYFTPEVAAITGTRDHAGAIRAVIATWLRILLVLLAVHFAVMIAAVTVTVLFGASGALSWEPFVLAISPLAMACSIGVALAAVLPHSWSTVLAMLATYAMWYLAFTTASVLPVNIGGATVSLAGLSYRDESVVASIVAGALATAAFLTLAVVAIRQQHFAWSMTLFSVVAVSLLLIGTLVGARGSGDRFDVGASNGFVCEGSSPRVCLTVDHSARVDEVARAIESSGRILTATGVDLSDVVLREELANGRPGADGVVLLPFERLNGIETSRLDYAHALLRPTDCADYHSRRPTANGEQLLDAAQALSEWMAAKLEGTDPVLSDDQAKQLYEGLLACSVSEPAMMSVRTP